MSSFLQQILLLLDRIGVLFYLIFVRMFPHSFMASYSLSWTHSRNASCVSSTRASCSLLAAAMAAAASTNAFSICSLKVILHLLSASSASLLLASVHSSLVFAIATCLRRVCSIECVEPVNQWISPITVYTINDHVIRLDRGAISKHYTTLTSEATS